MSACEMDCFWPRCSNHRRCNEFGSCVAKAQAGGATFDSDVGLPDNIKDALATIEAFITHADEEGDPNIEKEIAAYNILVAALHESAPEARSQVWSASKHDEIIKRLMNDIGQPNSKSVYGAFKQFANELHALSDPAPQASEVAAWVDVTDNGNVRFWTDDAERAAWESQRGRLLSQYTLAQLVTLAAKSAPGFKAAQNSAESDLVATPGCLGADTPPRITATTASAEPVAYASAEQFGEIIDGIDGSGVYIPLRKTPAGLFQAPLYASPPPPADTVREALERIADHDPDRPGLRYDSERQLIDSMVAIARQALDELSSTAPIEAGWRDISSVPLQADGIDLWCCNISQGSTDEARFTGMFINDDAKWEDWHGYILEPKWKPTHWMMPIAGPISRKECGGPSV